jgi:hypothetical protein
VTTVATSTVSDVDIAALVHVGEITSDATASSDGTTGQGSGSTTIAGLTVAGMSVSVTPSGIVLGPTIAPIAIGPLVNMVLSAVGVTLTLSPIEHVVSGAKAVEHAPALLISIDIPHNGGNTFQVIIGGAEAEAQASPGFTSSSPTSPPSATSTSGSTGSFSPASTGTTGNSGSSSPLPSSTNSAASPGESASSGGGAPVKFTNALPVDATKGLGAGLVIFGLLVGAAAAFGLGKIPDDVLADKPPSVCPNERSGS